MTRRITYVGQTPSEGTGSPVILLRHLRRLAQQGWEVTVIAEQGQDTTACTASGWIVQYLPMRRRWWPPFRNNSPLLRRIRTMLLGRECSKLSGARPPDAILGYLAAHADFSPEIAAHFARTSGAPLTLLVHDDAAAFAKSDEEKKQLRRRHKWIIGQTHRCWFVSPELAAEYAVAPQERRVLLPMPEGWPEPVKFAVKANAYPRIYYAGFIWPPQYRLLAEIAEVLERAGCRLVLLTKDSPELRRFLENARADWVPLFSSNREALVHLSENASGVLVSYTKTTAEMPWISTSFPSKLVEYSHLGLPAAIVSSEDSAVGQWARREAYHSFFPATDLAGFESWAEKLHEPSGWNAAAEISRQFAQGPFNPVTIQSQFEKGLMRDADCALT